MKNHYAHVAERDIKIFEQQTARARSTWFEELTPAVLCVRTDRPPTAKSDARRSRVEEWVELFNVAFALFHVVN